MTSDLVSLMWAPLLMCLVLTGIHAYLGIHVIAREVIFVDIALAQIAALGVTAAFLWGFGLESRESYLAGLGFTTAGAAVLALTRARERRVSQEAVIGVVYAVSAAGAVLLVDRAPHGAEHLRAMLVGNVLTVGGMDVVKVGALYAVIGALHWLCRRPLFLISLDPQSAYRGVLLVFSHLIVPSLAAIAVGGRISTRLVIGWGFGAAVSIIGTVASALLDLPTGATVVCAFGLSLLAWWAAVGRRGRQAAAA